jgi:hypothetical protein
LYRRDAAHAATPLECLERWNPLAAIEALTPDDVPSDPDLSVTFGG